MEDFGVTNVSLGNSLNYSNISSHSSDNSTTDPGNEELNFIIDVVTYVIIGIGFPSTLVAIYGLFSLVQKDHVAPIYVINLLISDLIQLCIFAAELKFYQIPEINFIISLVFYFALMASVCFMVCIALERYLIIAWPLWYHCRRTIKTSVVVCLVVWIIPAVYLIPIYYSFNRMVTNAIFGVFFLFPFPVLVFFLVGSLKALSASVSVTSDEKRQIVGTLVLVLLIYTVLFLPVIIVLMIDNISFIPFQVFLVLLRFSPLADLLLYIFMRKGMIDKILASVCCCRMDSNDTTMSSV